MNLPELRKNYHREICEQIIRIRINPQGKPVPNFADVGNKSSMRIALGITEKLGCAVQIGSQNEQTIGNTFERITETFLRESFALLQHVRPGSWLYSTYNTNIANFAQYEHLSVIDAEVKKSKELSSSLGRDYIVKPDIIIGRYPLTDDEININQAILPEGDGSVSNLTPFRSINQKGLAIHPFLHASVSCKWTIRSDRSQNTRTEALNLIRNRKGNLPHVVAVTAEPLPTRIAALALGTGDLDCVYHFALNELVETIKEIENEDQKDILDSMVDGNRLRDISDLPFDLAV